MKSKPKYPIGSIVYVEYIEGDIFQCKIDKITYDKKHNKYDYHVTSVCKRREHCIWGNDITSVNLLATLKEFKKST